MDELYQIVRNKFESGQGRAAIIDDLIDAGYTREKIDIALQEYDHDESTTYDDKLIATIEHRARKGERLQAIIDSLILDGNKPRDVERAMQRASISDGSATNLIKGASTYSYIQAIMMIACAVIGYVYDPIFYYAAGILLLVLILVSTGIFEGAREPVSEQLKEAKGISLLGYSGQVSSSMSALVINPATFITFGFLGLAGVGLFARNGTFAVICLSLFGFSLLGYFLDSLSK